MPLPPPARRISEALLRLAAPAWLGALFFVARANPYWRSVVWGLVLMLGMVGWGDIVARIVRAPRKVDLGLRLAWGMSATLALGGLGCWLHLASRPFLVGQTAIGCVFACITLAQGKGRPLRPHLLRALALRPHAYIVLGLALLMLAFEYLGQSASDWTNPSDDQPLYYFLPAKIVQTGTPLDPYDVRRMTTYGGQLYLHALFLAAVGKFYQLNLVDSGIGTLMVVALLVGQLSPRGLRRADAGHLALVLLLVVTLEHVRFNIGSLMTGLAALLGAYRTLLYVDEREPPGRGVALSPRWLALIAMTTCAACVLRTSNAMPIALFLGGAFILRTLPGAGSLKERLRLTARELIVFGALMVVLLFPWLLTFRESAGTLIYPLSRGNMTPDFAILKIEEGYDYNFKHMVRDLGYEKPIVTSLLFLLAGFAPLGAGSRSTRDYVPLLSAVCLLGMVFVSYMGGAFDESANSRYYFGFLVWTVLAIAMSISPPSGRPGRALITGSTRALLVVAAVVVHVAVAREELKRRLTTNLDAFVRGTTLAAQDEQRDVLATQDYQDVQGHVPAGEKVVVAVYEPFRFDMKRNDVFSLDLIGGMGPKPGYPAFQGPEALAKYLLDHGVRYVIHVDFRRTHDLYDVERWRRHKQLTRSFLNYEAPFMVDGMETLLKLDETRKVVYSALQMSVIDLATPH